MMHLLKIAPFKRQNLCTTTVNSCSSSAWVVVGEAIVAGMLL